MILWLNIFEICNGEYFLSPVFWSVTHTNLLCTTQILLSSTDDSYDAFGSFILLKISA